MPKSKYHYGARIAAAVDSPEGRVLDRWKTLYASQWGANKSHWSQILRSIILRYDQFLEHANEPDPELVLALCEALVHRGRVSCLFRPDYANISDVVAEVRKAPQITQEQRAYVLQRLDGMNFYDFARLIESVESYVGARIDGDPQP